MILSSAPKKLIIGSLLFLSTTGLVFASHAQYKGEVAVAPCPTIPALQDGFYVGLQGGYDSYQIKQTDTFGPGLLNLTSNSTGWVGGVFAGYGKDFNQFYLGGEAFINTSGASNTNSFSNSVAGVSGSWKNSVNQSYGLAVLPGLKFTPSTLGYVRLGYNWARLKGTGVLTGTSDNYSVSTTNTSGGFVYGVGIETVVPAISDKVSVRAEYTHTSYSSFRPTGGDVKFSPSDNQFMLGIIYHI